MDAGDLLKALAVRGYRARVVPIERLTDLEAGIKKLVSLGCWSSEFYDRGLAPFFNFDFERVLPGAKSMVVTAASQSPSRVLFGRREVIIPPSYMYHEIWEGTLAALTTIVAPERYKVARARVPMKLLAVRSGLALYGRNNISYVPGMGSFHRLGAFFTDMACEPGEWRQPGVMKTCRTCCLCLENCPTQCIKTGSRSIQAEKCLTYLNENEACFPEWVKPGWHNALVGCIVCQQVCPANKHPIDFRDETALTFSNEETACILARVPFDDLDPATRNKIVRLGMEEYYGVLGRNLAALGVPVN
jgi:epoxyqueuosine reductase